ncbi:MAG: hypothetical protein U0231_12650 [Nitrospiraceae bacterium]
MMHDLRVLRDNLEAIKEQLGARGKDVAWDDLRQLSGRAAHAHGSGRGASSSTEKGVRRSRAPETGRKQPADEAMAAMKAVGERIKSLEEQLRSVEERLAGVALNIPNLPHSSVPIGGDAAENVEVRCWGRLLL